MATGIFPTATETNTTLANVVGLVWTREKLNNFYRANLITANFFTDLSSDFQGGAKSVFIPNITEMTAHSKTNATAVTLNNPTDSKLTLTVDTWFECSFAIEKKEAKQVLKQYSYMEKLFQNAAYTSAAKYEDAIIALFPAFSQTTGTSAAGLQDSNIRAARLYLDIANAPAEDRAYFLHPTQVWTDLMAIDRFVLVQNQGGNDPVLKGFMGMLYGEPVFQSTRIGTTTGSYNSAYAHKDAIVHASTLMDLDMNYVPQYMSFLYTADVVYGVLENRDTSGVWIATKAY